MVSWSMIKNSFSLLLLINANIETKISLKTIIECKIIFNENVQPMRSKRTKAKGILAMEIQAVQGKNS